MNASSKDELIERFRQMYSECSNRPIIMMLMEGFATIPDYVWLEESEDGHLIVCYYLDVFRAFVAERKFDILSLERDSKRLEPCYFELWQSTHANKGVCYVPKKWKLVENRQPKKKKRERPDESYKFSMPRRMSNSYDTDYQPSMRKKPHVQPPSFYHSTIAINDDEIVRLLEEEPPLPNIDF